MIVAVDDLLVGSDAMMALTPYQAVVIEKAKVDRRKTCRRKPFGSRTSVTRVERTSIVSRACPFT